MYRADSKKAEEFISHDEILDTLKYAEENAGNRELISSIIEKARACKGISHREAALLLECNDQELLEEIFSLAKEIKQKFYGNSGKGNQAEILRQQNSDVRPAVSFKLLRKQLCVLPLPYQKQNYSPQKAQSGRYRTRSHSTSGHGTQTSGT